MDQTNTDYRCPLKRGNTQSAITSGSQILSYKYTNIKDLIWNPQISQYSRVKSERILKKSTK